MFCCLVGRKPGCTKLSVSVLERTRSSESPILLPSSGMRRRGKALSWAEHLPALASASYSLDIPVHTRGLWVSQVLSWVYGTLPLFPPRPPPALPRLSATQDSSLNTSYLSVDGIYRKHYKQEISNCFWKVKLLPWRQPDALSAGGWVIHGLSSPVGLFLWNNFSICSPPTRASTSETGW